MEHLSAPPDVYEQFIQLSETIKGYHPGLTADQVTELYLAKQSEHHVSRQKASRRLSHVPRTTPSTSDFTSSSAPNMHEISQATSEMNRHYSVQSAPAAVQLSRENSHSHRNYRSGQPSSISMWQHDAAAPFDGYGGEQRAPKRRKGVNIAGTFVNPNQYFDNLASTSQSQQNYTTISIPEQQPYDPNLLSATSTQPAWSPGSDSSMNSPSYSTDFTNVSSLSSIDMSRNATNTSFTSGLLCDGIEMMRMNSTASHFSDLPPSQSQSQSQAPFGAHEPQHHFPISNVQHDQSLEPFHNSCSNEIPSTHSYFPPSLQREGSSNNASLRQSRLIQRNFEAIQNSQRCSIAPAPHNQSSSIKNEDQAVRMERVTSQSGQEKVYAIISRESGGLSNKKQQTPKLYCPHCKDHPDGFRGEHELQRHVLRAHPPGGTKKVWICVDSSSDKKFLANCKACRTGKEYGAYYNAAAHLRRAHFNPRKRGRKSKADSSEKRGGKGGGNWPRMDHLKEMWMKEIEVAVDESTRPLSNDDDEHEMGEAGEMGGAFINPTMLDNHDPSVVSRFADYATNDSFANVNSDSFDVTNVLNLAAYASGLYEGDSAFFDAGMSTMNFQLQQLEAVGGQVWTPQPS